MAPKRKPANPPADPDGIFRGVSAFFVPHGVQSRRLEVALPTSAPLDLL
jgi:DNA polymerase lambda